MPAAQVLYPEGGTWLKGGVQTAIVVKCNAALVRSFNARLHETLRCEYDPSAPIHICYITKSALYCWKEVTVSTAAQTRVAADQLRRILIGAGIPAALCEVSVGTIRGILKRTESHPQGFS